MKKGLILALMLVSVTSFAQSLKTGELNRIECKAIGTNVSGTFSGVVKLSTQADEVIFADSFLAVTSREKSAMDAVVMEEMYGTQQSVAAGLISKGEVTTLTLTSQEDSEVKAYLVINLGMKGMNSRLTVDNRATYSSSCSVVK